MNESSGSRPLHIVFVMLNPGYVSHYGASLRWLIRRGHRVTIAYQSDRNKDGVEQSYGRALQAEYPDAVTIVRAPRPEEGTWPAFSMRVREWQDYLRYMRPEFRDAYALRARSARETPAVLRGLSQACRWLGARAPGRLERVLRAVDGHTPVSRAVVEFLRALSPDIVLVTPLVDQASPQVDFIRAAHVLGVPAGHCVASWDNLTNKGSMRVVPDRVFVWNEPQKLEAVHLHGVPPANVEITGAQLFDRWFETAPAHTRQEFAARVGLDPNRPFLLYLGSSSFIAPQEAPFVERWVRAIRGAADPALAGAGILIRPHPNNFLQYLGIDFAQFGNVSVWPPFGADKLDPAYKQDYFESMCYCAAAVGVNTSGMIEAGVLGRPVHTVLAPEFRHSQTGTLHFAHLTSAGGGLLHVAADLEQHVGKLSASLAKGTAADPRSVAFVDYFVRPRGRDRVAATVLAEAIERMGTLNPAPQPASAAARLGRVALYPAALIARLSSDGDGRPLWGPLVEGLVRSYLGAVHLRYTWRDRLDETVDSTRKATRRRAKAIAHRSSRFSTVSIKRARRGVRNLNKTWRRELRVLARGAHRTVVRLPRYLGRR